MCGISGVISIGELDMGEEMFFRQALVCGTVRGWDSTGIIRIGPEFEVDILKACLNGGEFIEQPAVKAMLNMKGTTGYISHNRSATIGGVNADNCHPFSHGKITLVHNGTLDSIHDLDMPPLGADTDSECICYTMSTKGESETLSLIDGAYVLIWMNEQDSSFNLARNYERPLHYAFDTAGTTVYFASERGMLKWLLERNKIFHKEIVMLKADTHHKLKFEEVDSKIVMKLVEYPIVKKHSANSMATYGGNGFSRNSGGTLCEEVEFNYLGYERYHPCSEYGKVYGVYYDECSRATQVVCCPVKISDYEPLTQWELLKGVATYSAIYARHPDHAVYITNNATQIMVNQETLVTVLAEGDVCHNCFRYEKIVFDEDQVKLCGDCMNIGNELLERSV